MATFNDLNPFMILSLISESKSLPNSRSSMLRLTARIRLPLPLLDPVLRLEPLALLPLPFPFPLPPPPAPAIPPRPLKIKPLRLSWLPLTTTEDDTAADVPSTTPKWFPNPTPATPPPVADRPPPLLLPLLLLLIPVLLLLPPDPPPLLLSVAAR